MSIKVVSGENLELYIKVAADSIKTLREVDVQRVLSECPLKLQVRLAHFIADQRPDLMIEVDELMTEEFGAPFWKKQK